MLFLKLLKSLISTLNSEGTPFQVAAGIAMGACLGLTPIGNVHNVIVVLLAMVLNLSWAATALTWTRSLKCASASWASTLWGRRKSRKSAWPTAGPVWSETN